ncbi:MAG TPA: tagaturonate epimerase family protein [Roseiflexaceae bacterium]
MSTSLRDAATGLRTIERLNILPRSLATAGGVELGLAQEEAAPRLAVLTPASAARLAEFEGETAEYGEQVLLVGPCSARNSAAMRALLPWLRPQLLGLRLSAGFGDRLGLATPGHIRALRAAGGEIASIFAQQSIREMVRTDRSPQQVMDDALWGVFAEGWQAGFGADADHLKTPADIDACLAAGFTFFTIDPGDHVDDRAEGAQPPELRAAFEQLPWIDLEDTPAALLQRYADRSIAVDEHTVAFDEPATLRAAVKYGRAVAHVVRMARHLAQAAGGAGYELEVSVDETASPTTHAEHFYIASELKRLGVQWVSLAPRYVGAFEKGVDYIGDLEAFERDFAIHAAIARHCGPYKLSLHSGSDKFSIYPIAARQTAGLVHLKTAGTSYLEALRTVAQHDPALFREIYRFAHEHYENDRASYHVSANLGRAPLPQEVADAAMPSLLDQFDARQIVHVTFGSVLTARTGAGAWRFRDRLMALLRTQASAYAANLESHFLRHLRPFAEIRDKIGD